MFDTHCHLNFKAFKGKERGVLERAKGEGVGLIVIPGTDFKTSQKAVELADEFKEVFAAVGIHPHHVFSFLEKGEEEVESAIFEIRGLVDKEKVVAIGEVGLDRHIYKKTKYGSYEVNEKFLELQKVFLKKQLELALDFDKALILHNREASDDLLKFLNENWDEKLKGRVVFHCCEPEEELLEFAIEKKIFIGFDGDLTYLPQKQVFFKKVPLKLLVFETDSPFLTPEPIRSKTRFPNEPANLRYVVEMGAYLKKIPEEKLAEIGEENGRRLFGIISNDKIKISNR